MKRALWAAFWVGVYLWLLGAPFLVLVGSPRAGGGGFLWDLAMALGTAAAALVCLMFVLTARFRRASFPFGVDIIYYFHRQLAWIAVVAAGLHAGLALVAAPAYLEYVDPAFAPRYLKAGGAAAFLLLLLVCSSVFRQPMGLRYDDWRIWHALLAVLTVATAAWHMFGAQANLGIPAVGGLWCLILASVAGVVVYVRLGKPVQMLRRPYRVEAVRPERGDAWTVQLRPVGHAGWSFLPGQFAWLTAGSSPFSWKEHPFSISSSAERAESLSFTIKELGDFTRGIGNLSPGETVYLDGPYGGFSCDRHDAPGYVFVAGGIGIAPVMGMLRTLADRQDRRPLLLFYGCGHWERVVFREEVQSLRECLNLEVVFVLEEPPEGWSGETGYVTEELLGRFLPDHRGGREYFLCGPSAMKEAVERALYRQRVPLERIHSELYELA